MSFARWAPLVGTWELSEVQARLAAGGPHSGLILSAEQLTDGTVSVDFEVEDAPPSGLTESVSGARILFGWDPDRNTAYAAGLGSGAAGYVIEQLISGSEPGGWNLVGAMGVPSPAEPGRKYTLSLDVLGVRARLRVDDVPVLNAQLPSAMQGFQLGLIGWGPQPIVFSNFTSVGSPPRLFVVMDFSPLFNAIYTEVIAPVARESGFEPRRGDEFEGPGQILSDITREIQEATVIVAEISERNPNVYYEIGYAHAVRTPTVLLARRGDQPLPFDISGFRCIFYDDTIGGKRHVEQELAKHLLAIRSSRELVL